MNPDINAELIAQLTQNERITKLALLCLAYRLVLLVELSEIQLTEEQGLEFEEIKEFFSSSGVIVKEDDYGAILFEYKHDTPVIQMPKRRTQLPQDVVTEFVCGVEIGENWLEVAEQIASAQYEDMEALISRVREFAKNPKRYDRYIRAVEQMSFYRPHFTNPKEGPIK